MADSQDKLSIIVLSWNSKNLLKGCLKSLGEGCGSVDGCKVIIVDNGSTDGSKEYLKSQISKLKTKTQNLKLIFNKENVGFAKGNNIGIKEAKSEYIMLLNSDTIVQPGAIKILLDFLDRYHTCQIAASPLLVLPNGEPQFDYYMKFPNLWQIFLYHSPVLRPIVRKIPFLNT